MVKTYTVQSDVAVQRARQLEAPELANESFGAVIEVTSGPGIAVERAIYSDRARRGLGGGHERAGDAAAVGRPDAHAARRLG